MFVIVMADEFNRPVVARIKGLPKAREMWDWLTGLGYVGDPRP